MGHAVKLKPTRSGNVPSPVTGLGGMASPSHEVVRDICISCSSSLACLTTTTRPPGWGAEQGQLLAHNHQHQDPEPKTSQKELGKQNQVFLWAPGIGEGGNPTNCLPSYTWWYSQQRWECMHMLGKAVPLACLGTEWAPLPCNMLFWAAWELGSN